MENIIDQEFADSFNELYLDLTILNYKQRTKFQQFSEKEVKTIKYLKLLIPILKRLQNDGDQLELDNILQEVPGINITQTQVLKPMVFLPDTKIIKDLSSEEKEELSEDDKDEEGDIQVNKLTENVLALLSNIQKNNWAVTEIEPEEVIEQEEIDEIEEIEEMEVEQPKNSLVLSN